MLPVTKMLRASRVAPMGGGTQPKCRAFTSDGEYVLKLGTAPQDGRPCRTGFNESLGYALACEATIDVPPFAFVEVTPDTAREGVRAPDATYFGSRIAAGYEVLPSAADRATLDQDSLYRLWALDVLLKIPDRKPSDVLRKVGAKEEFLAIDYGNSLGESHWTPSRFDAASNAEHVGSWLFWFFGDGKTALTGVSAIKLAAERATDFVQWAGDLWNIDLVDRKAAAEFIGQRASDIERLMRDDVRAALKGPRES
jgi:hypothetical protein